MKMALKLFVKFVLNTMSTLDRIPTTNLWNHLKFKHKNKFIELDRLRRGVSGLESSDLEVTVNDDGYIDEPNSAQTSSNSNLDLNPSTSNFSQIKMSEVWQVFTKHENGTKVICKICSKHYVNSGSNTTNLWNHLKFKHKNKYIELDRLRRGVSGLESPDLEVTVNDDGYIDEPNSAQTSSNSNLDLNPSTSNFSQSFVFDSLNPSTSTIIEESSSKIIDKQTKMTQFTLNKTSKIKIDNALAYFIATSMTPYNVVEKEGFKLFVNALNPSYKLPSRKTVTESRIPNLYIETRNSVGKIIKRANYVSFTTDCWTSSSNKPFIAMTCHFNTNFKLESVCLGCIELSEDHTGENIADIIQILILDYEIPDWKICSITTDHGSNMLKAVENLGIPHVDCFGHALNIGVSVILNLDSVKSVVNKVNLPKKKIPSYSKTRWWSMLELINVIIDQDLRLASFLRAYKNGNHSNLIFQESDVILKNLKLILQPIREITDNLAGDSYVTGSLILPIIAIQMMKHLIEVLEINQLYKKKRKTGLSAIFCILEVHNIQEITITLKMKIENELNLYLTIPKCSYDQEPLEWWNMNKDTYPMLSLLVEKNLTVQATSVASERVFRKGGCILTDLRSSLSNDHASQLIYLTMNKVYVPKPIF
ncbi:zinc finger BED domain-containing protein 1-like [Aphis craccivora]|uniref:Zinc finger BED domain-containing protein 1-like n=1 Tax=Aphis craccivora TaxID=307492 RepID=A0A6G0Y6J5_APHCR|nr:zinc finger BED domain-containing protein 1-like [Aphis craccivora]